MQAQDLGPLGATTEHITGLGLSWASEVPSTALVGFEPEPAQHYREGMQGNDDLLT